MTVTAEKSLRLLNDSNVQEQVKMEDYLAVAAGGRRVAMLLSPVDFPAGERIRQSIDEGFSRRYYVGGDRGGFGGLLDRARYGVMRAIMNPLKYKASLLRESYEQAVFDHPNYKAHRRWADDLGVQIYETQLRPSVDEIYVVCDQSTVGEVGALMVRRDKIRRQMLQDMREGDRRGSLFMPEERSSEYLEHLGRLLSYPDCCISAYIDDVRDRVDSGLRVSNQLADENDVDGTAFFAAAFYPCCPDCEAARAIGNDILNAVGEIDERFRRRMSGVFQANKRYVARYPEVLKRRRQQMMSRYMGVSADEQP